MKNILKVSLFAMGLILSSGVMAATGTGEAQAELSNPLRVYATRDVNFGTIAIDPAAGAQTVTLNDLSIITCPVTYSCSGSPLKGLVQITGYPNGIATIALVGTATLDDGLGNTIVFDPVFANDTDTFVDTALNVSGLAAFGVGGELFFTGSEPAGTYTSQNGSAYQLTVNY